MSLLCAMLALNPASSPSAKTGAITAMSGACGTPPSYGWFTMNASPSRSVAGG